MVIARPELGDADVAKLAERFKGVIEGLGGTVQSAEKWEKRKLTYEINGCKEGNYILFQFECNPTVPREVDRLMGINDDIIRHRIFSKED